MKTSKLVEITCPYCGLKQNHLITTVTSTFYVTTCEAEDTEEGCGKQFVINADWFPVVKVFKMTEVTE